MTTQFDFREHVIEEREEKKEFKKGHEKAYYELYVKLIVKNSDLSCTLYCISVYRLVLVLDKQRTELQQKYLKALI